MLNMTPRRTEKFGTARSAWHGQEPRATLTRRPGVVPVWSHARAAPRNPCISPCRRFPARNRLIAALADTVLVVEARARSGALITADHALDLGRDVLAVPGWAGSPAATGTNGLLKAGAGMIENEDDLAAWLGLEPPSQAAPPAEDAALVDAAASGPAHVEELADRLGSRRTSWPQRSRVSSWTAGSPATNPAATWRSGQPGRAAAGRIDLRRGVAQLVERRSPKP